jgi:hypothetical protein
MKLRDAWERCIIGPAMDKMLQCPLCGQEDIDPRRVAALAKAGLPIVCKSCSERTLKKKRNDAAQSSPIPCIWGPERTL